MSLIWQGLRCLLDSLRQAEKGKGSWKRVTFKKPLLPFPSRFPYRICIYICMYVYDKGMFMESFVLQIESEQLSDNKYS